MGYRHAILWCILGTTGPYPLAGEQHRLAEAFGRLPIAFEANQGQAPTNVRFLARGVGFHLVLTEDASVLVLSRPRPESGPQRHKSVEYDHASIQIRLAGSESNAQLSGGELLPGKVNYFIGDDPAAWRTGVPTFGRVQRSAVYPGIDMVYYGSQRDLEYDFVIAPGADPNQIRLTYEGADSIEGEANGDLLIRTRIGAIRQHRPFVYQNIGGSIRELPGRQLITGRNEIRFKIDAYDRRQPLIIDPKLSYATLLGGGGSEISAGLVVDSAGNAYVSGGTSSATFPITPGAAQTTPGPRIDAFVSKLNPTGTALVYSTFLGGSGNQVANAVRVDSAGNAYVGGLTTSINFPTTASALQRSTADSCCTDGFVVKLNASGSQLLYSTYLAGTLDDDVAALSLDSSGNAYVVGETDSGTSFPTTSGALQTLSKGVSNAFVSKLNSAGSSLVYSTLLGATGRTRGTAIQVDTSGNTFVSGWTESVGFPIVAGGLQTTPGGLKDVFATKINSTGTALLYSTFIGGIGDDLGFDLGIDTSGNAYITGRTQSDTFPTTNGAFQKSRAGNDDIFVCKLSPTGAELVYSTFIGGAGSDIPWGIAVDGAGVAFLTGRTESANFPKSPDAFQSTLSGSRDAFLTALDSTGSTLLYSSFFGGSGVDEGLEVALDSTGSAYIAGQSGSANFPTSSGSFQTGLRGDTEGFVVKFESMTTPASSATISIVSGNNQTGSPGAVLPLPLVIELRDAQGAMPGVPIAFAATNATVAAATVRTGSDGRASTGLTLGSAIGPASVSARTPDGTSVTFSATVQPATTSGIRVVSAASFAGGPLAPGMIATIFGERFASTIASNTAANAPLSLGGVTVLIRDSGGGDRMSPLFFVSPSQINFLIPEDCQGGPATVRVTTADGRLQTADILVESVSPGLFSANGDGAGVAAAGVLSITAQGSQTTGSAGRYDESRKLWVPAPIDLGEDGDQTILSLYGTGVRLRTGLENVNVTIGGAAAEVLFAGLQPDFAGLDQINLRIPRSLKGRGEVDIVLLVDGKQANKVTAAFSGPLPSIRNLTPTGARAGETVNNFRIEGINLAATSEVQFDPPAGIGISSISIEDSSLAAILTIAPDAAAGTRQVAVITPAGRSNSIPFLVSPAVVAPKITSITPTSARVGDTVTDFHINGSGLSDVSAIVLTPADGIVVSGIRATAASVVATITISATANSGNRQLKVVSPSGASNSQSFTVLARTSSVVPSISRVSVQGPSISASRAVFSGSFDFIDGDGDIVYTGNTQGSASLEIRMPGCTVSATGSFLHKPGALSGSVSFNVSWAARTLSIGTPPSTLVLVDAAGHKSNAFDIGGVGLCP